MSRNSNTSFRAATTLSVLVRTTTSYLPSSFLSGGSSLTGVEQAVWSLGIPSTSTMHMRQLPAMDRAGW